MNRLLTLYILAILSTAAFAQNPRLSQLDEYLQQQRDNVIADSIRNVFAGLSKKASDSYRYEYHKGDSDTIRYELVFRHDDNSGQKNPIRELARFYCYGTQAEYHHGYKDHSDVSGNDMKSIEVVPLTVLRQPATTATEQPNPRLKQLENYLQEQGLKRIVNNKLNTSATSVRHYWSGQLTAYTPKAILDSIRTVFTRLSKETKEAHMYESHKNNADTIEYSLTFTYANETATFTYKKNSDGQKEGIFKHIYDEHLIGQPATVADAIAARQWHVDISTMNSMRYGSKTVTPDFYLELRGDTLRSYLPYLGQAYQSSMMSPAIGLNFEEPVRQYKQSMPKSKKYTQIEIDVRTREDSYHYVIEIYDSGETTIRVRSLYRDPISFDGTLEIAHDKK